VIDPRTTANVTQPSIDLLSPSKHDDSAVDSSTVTSRSFDMVDLQSYVRTISEDCELTDNGKVHLVGIIAVFILFDLEENKNIEHSANNSFCDEDSNEHVYEEDSDEDPVNKESSDDSDEEELFDSNEHCTERNFTATEIALALSLLKSRHSLTNTCISNICRLLKLLRVPNSPSSFRHVRSLICSPYKTTIFGETLISCPSCHNISAKSTHCSTSSNCISKDKFVSNPTINHILRLEPQIRSILERNYLMTPNTDENCIRDIIDAPFYRRLVDVESTPFVTLLMNSDGAVVKSISKSVWITSFVINELPYSVRFNRENIIIGMVSVGSMKPHKNEMQLFLEHLVKELIDLERDGLAYTRFSSSTRIDETMRVFLITAVCDKPAASLLINHTECGGYFGCISCKIVGM
jgi:hypothetical protein